MDTDPQWRGQRDTSRRRLWRMLLLSLGLHLPITPVLALFGLLSLLPSGPPEVVPPSPPINAIPVDLIEDDRPGPGAGAQKPAAGEPAGGPASSDDPFADLDKELDSEAEMSAALEPDKPKEKPGKDAGAQAEQGLTDAGTGPAIGDPVSLSGAAGRVADSNANVRLLIHASRMRNHPLGQRVGTLLGMAQQWHDFFGPGGLDPIKDVDEILIAGPQLKDSSEVVAVLGLSAPQARIRAAIDALVKRDPQGTWLDAGVPAAKARADRAERVFVLPAPGIVVVAPPSAADHALSLGSSLRFPKPKGGVALTTYVVTPWRAFVGIPFKVPKSIKWVRMSITPTSDGGAVADLIAEDESADAARNHAEELTRNINAVTLVKVPFLGSMRLIEPVSFVSKDTEIRGKVVATPKQLKALLEAVSDYAALLAKEAAEKAKAQAQADAGAPVNSATATSGAPAPSAAPAASSAPAPSAAPDFRDE